MILSRKLVKELRKKLLHKQAKGRCDEIISRADDTLQSALKALLQGLFLRLRYIYTGTPYDSHLLREWRPDRRICSPDMFEKTCGYKEDRT
jgi:hypothetical protein